MPKTDNLCKSIVLLTFIFLVACRANNVADMTNWNSIDIEEGDIVFRLGNSMASKVVVNSDPKGHYSHVGVVVLCHDSLKVAHAVPGESAPNENDKVKMERLSEFFGSRKAQSGCIVRYALNANQKHAISDCADSLYYRNVLFDHDYCLTDNSKVYCTELVWLAFKNAGIDITDNKRTYIHFMKFKGDMIFPSDIFTNKKLQLIYSFNNH